MSAGDYLSGMLALLLVVGGVGFAAARLRSRLVPGWTGAPARLAEVTLGVGLLVVSAELLGLFGLLRTIPVVAMALAVALAAELWARRAPAQASPGPASWPAVPRWARIASWTLAGLVLARWSLGTLKVLDHGIWAFDAIWYHMPLAAGFAQSGSVTQVNFLDPLSLARFYPANSELIHGVGITLVHRDFLTPILNLGWLTVALMAAWTIGRPFGTAPLSLVVTATVLGAHSFTSQQPGNPMSDIVAAALLLASAAMLVTALHPGARGGSRPAVDVLPPIALAGLAAGLAAGTKLNLVAPVAILTLGVVLVARPGSRRRVAATWVGACLLTGGYWYVRNFFVTGNPLPWFKLGVGPLSLPATPQVSELRPDFSVAHYLTDGRVWDRFFLPGLHVEFGDLWPVLLVLALGGMAAVLLARGSDPLRRVLAATAAAGALAYLVTPLGAGGFEGRPVIFAVNLRWLVPFLALGAALLPTALGRLGARVSIAVGSISAALLVMNLDLGRTTVLHYVPDGLELVLIVGAAVAGLALVARRVRSPAVFAGAMALTLVAAVLAYWPQASHYIHKRYAQVRPYPHLTTSFRWARSISGARIGLAGTTAAFFQYPYYGNDISNAVQFVARQGPHGSFIPYANCPAWRAAVNRGHFNYLVTSRAKSRVTPHAHRHPPEEAWASSDPATRAIIHQGPMAVFRVRGKLDPNACAGAGAGALKHTA